MDFIIAIAVSVSTYYVLKYTIGEPEYSFSLSKKNKYILWFSLVVWFSVFLGINWYGKQIPGSMLESSNYENRLYVHMYPGDQETKSYKVPALIERYTESKCYGEDQCYTDEGYRIHYAVMPNGGTINFYDDYGIVELNKIIKTIDDNDREWGVELTNEPVR